MSGKKKAVCLFQLLNETLAKNIVAGAVMSQHLAGFTHNYHFKEPCLTIQMISVFYIAPSSIEDVFEYLAMIRHENSRRHGRHA